MCKIEGCTCKGSKPLVGHMRRHEPHCVSKKKYKNYTIYEVSDMVITDFKETPTKSPGEQVTTTAKRVPIGYCINKETELWFSMDYIMKCIDDWTG